VEGLSECSGEFFERLLSGTKGAHDNPTFRVSAQSRHYTCPDKGRFPATGGAKHKQKILPRATVEKIEYPLCLPFTSEKYFRVFFLKGK
jgi:hypothetical protein